jgi:hypothetical protein
MPITEEYRPSVTSWQLERDGLLDQISYLEDCVNRTGEYLLGFEKQHMEVSFEVAEALLILFETKIDNDIRRGFDIHSAGVLDSGIAETEEETA